MSMLSIILKHPHRLLQHQYNTYRPSLSFPDAASLHCKTPKLLSSSPLQNLPLQPTTHTTVTITPPHQTRHTHTDTRCKPLANRCTPHHHHTGPHAAACCKTSNHNRSTRNQPRKNAAVNEPYVASPYEHRVGDSTDITYHICHICMSNAEGKKGDPDLTDYIPLSRTIASRTSIGFPPH